MNAPVILTISGPSCSGKSTLADRLKSRGWASTRSFTTRAPRAGEVDGVHYDFRDEAWFRKQRAGGRIVEFNRHGGAIYGTTVEALRRAAASGAPVVSVLDPNGVVALRKECSRKMSVFSLFLNAGKSTVLSRLPLRHAANDEAARMAYASRLSAYLNVERYWLEDYFKHFDLIMSAFSPETEADIVAAALALSAPAVPRSLAA